MSGIRVLTITAIVMFAIMLGISSVVPAVFADLPTPDNDKSGNSNACASHLKNMKKAQDKGNTEQEKSMAKYMEEHCE